MVSFIMLGKKKDVLIFIFFCWLMHVPFVWMVLLSVLLFVHVVINLYVKIQVFSTQEEAAQEEDHSHSFLKA